jgi:hypothetical protein
VLNSSLQGTAWALSTTAAQLAYAALQTRIKTATGEWLDIISNDFYGSGLSRYPNESDTQFRARILSRLFMLGPSRADMSTLLTLITGRVPLIIEPWRVQDCGAWDAPSFGWDTVTASGCGHWAEQLPYQCFIEAYTPVGTGIPYVAGWDQPEAGWDTASQGEWTDAGMVAESVTEETILGAIESCRMAGTRIWTRIEPSPQYP